MAGIYIHIPFCKQACHYCNFHFSTSLKYKSEMIAAILTEIEMRQAYLSDKNIDSIYFGGGTPSLLSVDELSSIFEKIKRFYTISEDAEITLEANPDDLNRDKLAELASSPINRLSIGVQSFSEADLTFMNRAHNSEEAENCIRWAKEAGFDNLTIDLIYGTPTMSNETWETNIQKVLEFDISHISCYCLTVEPQTALDHFVRVGKVQAVDEEKATYQFELLMERLKAADFLHYEISNFAKKGHFAQHNSNYWKGVPYLGIGPSAHSFDGKSRQWNVANNAQYLKAIEQQELKFEKETLTLEQQYNEYVMTRLRTIWGCELDAINNFGAKFEQYFLKTIEPFLMDGKILLIEGTYRLSSEGKLIADRIAMELFYED